MKIAPLLALALGACEVGGFGDRDPDGGTAGADAPSTSTTGGGNVMTTSSSGSTGPTTTTGSGGVPGSGGAPPSDAAPPSDFVLRPEYAGPCTRAPGAIDVNLGNEAEAFVRAAHCQVTGTEPTAGDVSSWATQLRTNEHTRRIDVVRTFCRDAGRTCTLSYSNPWLADVPLSAGCTRKTARDLGAVLMFFSNCPGQVNCRMDWANTHAAGMSSPNALYAFGSTATDYYNPKSAGFWYRELLDARWAGLQFLLLNVYGPDLSNVPDPLAMLGQALDQAGPGVKIAMLDDTWAWGQASSPPAFQPAPNLSDTEGAAQRIYQAKWKPFFSRVKRDDWYLVSARPFIYFYNAGTVGPPSVASGVVARMKQLFAEDFGTEPFVAVDDAYFQDPNMPNVADARFTWDTIRTGRESRFTMKGVTLSHFMVKWDSLGRDKPGAIAVSTDRILKGTSLLSDRLASSQDSQIAVIATWNDLGEGTGVERNYDYYIAGSWRPPTAFMSLTRAAQCSD